MNPAIPLSRLTARLDAPLLQGDAHRPVSGITHDSRAVRAGDLFVCLRGATFDGHRFAADAAARGAAALVAEPGGLEAAGVSVMPAMPVVRVRDTRKALAALACAFYGDPSHRLLMIGVTGTNGKTTTTRMIAAILRAAGRSVGTIGTLGTELDGRPIPSEHTTPEADQLQRLLYGLAHDGADAVVMEVSSHALAQHRTDGIAFNAAVFTNLTQDHLDYHTTMEEYFDAKARLFAEYPILYPRRDGALFVSAINVADWPGKDLVTRARGDIITFTTGANPASLRAEEIVLSPGRSSFMVVYDAGVERFCEPVVVPLGGAFQVNNALGAIAVTLRLGIPFGSIARGLATMPPVPGRFEPVESEAFGFSVIVDYAHTPDGLLNLIMSARALTAKRLILVFGCGGDRDRTKRPVMGRIAAERTDLAIVTSDNPRSEEPEAIIADILEGMRPEPGASAANVIVEPDRRAAIRRAVSAARPGDLVVIAGKGHEDYQIVGDRVLPFDDRLEAREALATLPTAGAR